MIAKKTTRIGSWEQTVEFEFDSTSPTDLNAVAKVLTIMEECADSEQIPVHPGTA